MPEPLVCVACRSVVVVPPGYTETRIHCGICWAEVDIPRVTAPPPPKPAPPKYVGTLPDLQLPDPPAVGSSAAAGMAPLEALIGRAAARLNPPKQPVAPPKPPPPKTPSVPVIVMPAVVPARASGVRPKSVPDAELLDPIPPPPPPAARARPVSPPPPPPPPPTPASSVPVLRKASSAATPAAPKSKPSAFDDEDDRPRRPPPRSNGPIVLAVAGGLFTLLLIAAGVFVAVRLLSNHSKPPATDADDTSKLDRPLDQPGNRPNPAPLPDLNPPPPAAPPDRVAAEGGGIDWQEVPGADGFAAKMPPPVRVLPASEVLHDANRVQVARGQRFLAIDRGFTFEIVAVGVPAGADPDVARLAKLPGVGPGEVRAARVGGQPGFESEQVTGQMFQHKQAVRVGARLFVLQTRLFAVGDRTAADAAAARAAFTAGFKVTADPDAPPPADPLAPNNDPWPFDGPAPKLAARIDPFLAAVVFPKKGELFTVGLRPGSRTQGILRRYTYPGFVPKNSYHLPHAGTFMVGSEADGRIAVATVGKPPDGPMIETERWMVTGDVQVFDLADVLAGKVAERDELKPTATIPIGAKIAGLELLADGRSAAALTLLSTTNKTRPWRTRLMKLDLAGGKVAAELELPDPAWRLRRSPDGSKLFAAEVPLTPNGAPILNVARVANVLVVDAGKWQKERTLTTPGPAFDLSPDPAGGFVAAVAVGGDVMAYTVPADGQTAELRRNGRSTPVGHVGLTPDGRRLVTAVAVGQGFAVYDLTADGPARVVSGRTAKGANPADAQVPLGGAFDLSPDGRYALLHAGLVVEVGR